MKDFDAAALPVEQMRVMGHTFDVLPDVPAGVLVRYGDLAEQVERDRASVSNSDLIFGMFDVIKSAIIPEQRDEWEGLRDEIGAHALNQVGEWVFQRVAGRPFEKPSTSPVSSPAATSPTASTDSSDSLRAVDSSKPAARFAAS